MNAVPRLTQSVWDVRRLIGWIRDQGAHVHRLYGVSLGGYLVSLLAGLEDGLDGRGGGHPGRRLPALFHDHSPHDIRARAIEHRILGGPAE